MERGEFKEEMQWKEKIREEKGAGVRAEDGRDSPESRCRRCLASHLMLPVTSPGFGLARLTRLTRLVAHDSWATNYE